MSRDERGGWREVGDGENPPEPAHGQEIQPQAPEDLTPTEMATVVEGAPSLGQPGPQAPQPQERQAPWRPPTPAEAPTIADAEAPTQMDGVGGSASERYMPDRIGPYRVLTVLGEGGMGCVYLAEQLEPVQRYVAIKLIRASLTSPASLIRFNAERQAMARLSHPGIAQIFEAGTTDDGFPYFVMENVPGKPVTHFCDRQCSTLQERLELMIRICHGVEHAHRKGILHRDLKPSNVLVVAGEDEATPKIIDFGIAKAMDQPLTDETVLTRFGIGTPTYMSPEAFEVTPEVGSDVDTRTDVYSLGIMLYELLVGSPPYDTRGSSLAEIVHQITHESADIPSRRFNGLAPDERKRVAAGRQLEPDGLARQLRGDLDWIVDKAMAKERDRRYGSATELAADLRRHLDLEPVSAGPPSLSYRSGRFVRRHKAAVVGASLAVLAMLLGIFGTTYAMVRANREADRANQEAAKTREALLDAEAVTGFLVNLFEITDPREVGGESVTARQVLDRGASVIESRLTDQPLRRARLMHTIGTIYNQLQVPQEAQRLVSSALDLRRRHLTADHVDVAESLYRLAVISRELADYEKAEEFAGQALRIRRAGLGPDHPSVGEIERELGVILFRAGQHERAEEHIRQALVIAEQGDDPESEAAATEALGNLLKARGRCDEATPHLRKSLEIRERWLEPLDPRLAYSLNNLSSCLGEAKQFREAKVLLERALEIQEQTLGPEATTVAMGRSNLGILYRELEEHGPAEAAFIDARDSFIKALGPEHPVVANPMAELGVLYWQMGRMKDAEAQLQPALDLWQRKLGDDHLLTAWAQWGLANVLRDVDRLDEAETLYLSSIQTREAQLPEGHPYVREALTDYSELLRRAGRSEDLLIVEEKLQAF